MQDAELLLYKRAFKGGDELVASERHTANRTRVSYYVLVNFGMEEALCKVKYYCKAAHPEHPEKVLRLACCDAYSTSKEGNMVCTTGRLRQSGTNIMVHVDSITCKVVVAQQPTGGMYGMRYSMTSNM